jgi:toxin FitB
MADGKRRDGLNQRFDEVLWRMNEQIISFDTEAAQLAAALMAARKIQGRPRDLRDTMIAGIVLARHATLATRNASHFDDVAAPLVDPWTVSA